MSKYPGIGDKEDKDEVVREAASYYMASEAIDNIMWIIIFALVLYWLW